MTFAPLSAGAGDTLARFQALAEAVHDAHARGDGAALALIRAHHPRYRHGSIPWLVRDVSTAAVATDPVSLDDARLAVARWHDYLDWDALALHVEATTDPASRTGRFERAVEHVVDGNLAALRLALAEWPALAQARSSRRTWFDPPSHAATLLHYVAANGVEGHRQRTPANVVAVARLLLEAGADSNALARMYGSDASVLGLLVSSAHPRQAGCTGPLIELLVGHGASPDALGTGPWSAPLHAALVFGYGDAAAVLVRCGARVDTLPVAAGLGQAGPCAALLPGAAHDERQAALAMAVLNRQGAVAQLLLEAGVDPSALHPEGYHSHATPLHQAALAGDLAMCELLLSFGADPARRDTIYGATPIGWAEHAAQAAVVARLRPITPDR